MTGLQAVIKSVGKSSRHILQRICAFRAKTIHLIFDRVTSPSIKDMERDKRTDSDRNVHFKIAGENQLRPIDFGYHLLVSSNVLKAILLRMVLLLLVSSMPQPLSWPWKYTSLIKI
ncbi:hypothetical protein OUZ56_026366 [Daphnia magna]|uniref:Uncharacterized protein n=1 Tax=Daphnia magna TaxID=35525 RepID=A0ABQ9ZLI9_9CRUS|nr:hypothetical protein OUZ56_026366 [Daphnia magna]